MNGTREVLTPAIDKLAADGMRFVNMRANCTVCSPSRAALMTGMFADRAGVPGVIRTEPENSWGHLATNTVTLADALRTAGYHTALVGKWHLGLAAPNLPNQRGFDLFHGFLGDMMDSYTQHLRGGKNFMRKNSDVLQTAGTHATELFSDWACDYLRDRAQAKQPFFLYLCYNAPHFPVEPPADCLARVKARHPEMPTVRAKMVAMVEHLDAGVARVLETLRQTGLERDTLVVFTSDNGGCIPVGSDNSPWRGAKEDHYDGGLRVPFVVRWPVGVEAGAVSHHAGLVFDLFPMALELANAPVSSDLDAVSLLPALKGQAPDTSSRQLYFVRREGGKRYGGKAYEALILGDWKLVQNTPYSPMELFNLRDDPDERNDLSASNVQQLERLRRALQHHVQQGGCVPWQPGL